MEETQYHFTPTGLLAIYRAIAEESPEITYLRFSFIGNIGHNLGGNLDQDIISAEWLSLEEIRASREQHRSPLVLECIEDYLTRSPCSLDLLSTLYA